jgi:ATP-dependent Clp protease ATP-binding subunit ClpB
MFTINKREYYFKIVGLQLKSVTKMLALQGITMDATASNSLSALRL